GPLAQGTEARLWRSSESLPLRACGPLARVLLHRRRARWRPHLGAVPVGPRDVQQAKRVFEEVNGAHARAMMSRISASDFAASASARSAVFASAYTRKMGSVPLGRTRTHPS